MDESERMPASSFLHGSLIGQDIIGENNNEGAATAIRENTSSGKDSTTSPSEFQEISSSSLLKNTSGQQQEQASSAQDSLLQHNNNEPSANSFSEVQKADQIPLVEMRDFLGVPDSAKGGGIMSSHIPGIQTPEGVNLSPKIGAQSIVDNLMKGSPGQSMGAVDFGGRQQSPKNVDMIGVKNQNQDGIIKRGGGGAQPGNSKSVGVEGKPAGVSEQNGGSQENDSFYKMYNKEIKVNQDEIPIILAELTDAAFNFIQREQYEKALILLQKTEGVLEVVSLEGSSRDKYISFITFNNMSMCFQKLGMLEECIFYLKNSIALVSDPKFYRSKKISMRNRKTCQECKLKLQLCAILSQNQNHTEALDNARASVKLSHKMFADMEELCQLYIDKITYRDNLQAAHEQSDLDDNERVQLISMVLDSSPAKEIPKDFLEQSISLVERSSLKMCPVVKEVRKRLVNAPKMHQNSGNSNEKKSMDTEAIAGEVDNSGDDQLLNKDESKLKSAVTNEDPDDIEEEKPDMRSVLGFLNQNEWIYNLNIGNIMQIQPISTREFLQEPSDEIELGRDSFLSKLSILTVAYFCMSTEMRFLLQSRAQFLKPEVKRERDLESEYWHAKALEIACTFLPSECPLLNHVLLSYQKHHDPTLQPIKEDEEQQDLLSVLRPLKGIDQSKYQPIVRLLPQVKVNLSPTIQRSSQLDQPVVKEPYVSLKEILRQQEQEQIEQVLNFNPSQVRRIGKHADQETQVYFQLDQPTSLPLSRPSELNENNPSFVAHLRDKFNQPRLLNGDTVGEDLALGINSGNMLPFSLNESQAEPDSQDVRSLKSHKTSSTQKLKEEVMGQGKREKTSGGKKGDKKNLRSNGNRKQNLARNSIEGLEQQIMNAVRDSPLRDKGGIDMAGEYREYMPINPSGKDFHFDSQESLLRGVDSLIPEDMQANFGANNSQVYDQIVDKLIDNPRIDKRTLFQKMIAKLELEQNLQGQQNMQGEIGQLKRLIEGFRPVDDIQVLRLDAQMSEEANLSQNVDKMSSHLNESSKEEEQRVSTQKRFSGKKTKIGAKNAPKDVNKSDIIVSKSAKQLVPKVHDSRDSAPSKESQQHLVKSGAAKERFDEQKGINSSVILEKHTSKEISKNASKTRKNRQKKDRHATQQYHHASQQQIKPQSAKIAQNQHKTSQQGANQQGRPKSSLQRKGRFSDNKQTGFENENDQSLLKDITDYQDPLNMPLGPQDQSIDISDNSIVETDDVAIEILGPSKQTGIGLSESGVAFNANHQISIVTAEAAFKNRDRSSSNKKSTSLSRPSTGAATQVTRSSSHICKRRRNTQLAHQQQLVDAQMRRSGVQGKSKVAEKGQQPNANPRKQLTAQQLEETQRQSRSESSSKNRFTASNQQRFNQSRGSGRATATLTRGPQVNNFATTAITEHETKRKLASGPQRFHHNASVDQHPNPEDKLFQKLSQKRLSANRHNTSQQQVNSTNNGHMQRHMTSKLKKLVSQKQIETGQGFVANKRGKGFTSGATKSLGRKQVLNHTKPVNEGFGGRMRSRGNKKSYSRSSGKKTYSVGSSRKSRSRSNPSHGEVQRSLQNELHQYSFDHKNTHEVVQQFGKPHIINIKKMDNHASIGDLQRQVLENQRTLLDFMNKKRANSSESRGRSGSQARRKNQTTAQNLKDLLPQKMKSLQSHGFSQPALNFHSQTSMIKSHSRSIVEPKSKLGGADRGGHNKENAGDFRNNRSQNANSLATFMKYISGRRATENTMNKSLQYLRRHQKYSTTQQHSKTGLQGGQQRAASREKHLQNAAKAQTIQDPHEDEQLEFKRKLKKEVDLLRKRMGVETQNGIKKNSPKRKKSDSRKSQADQRSGSRNSRSRSPVQPSIARIPKKKSFQKLLGNQKNLNFTAAEVNKTLVRESMLNLSVGEVAKNNKVLVKSNLLNRKVENLLPGRLYNDNIGGVNGTDLNFLQEFGEMDNQNGVGFSQEKILDRSEHIEPLGNNGAHSLSMFDSEINDKNKSQFLPLHHNFSQNVMQVGNNFSNNILMQGQHQNNPALQARILNGLTQSGIKGLEIGKKAGGKQLPQKKVNRLRQRSALGYRSGANKLLQS